MSTLEQRNWTGHCDKDRSKCPNELRSGDGPRLAAESIIRAGAKLGDILLFCIQSHLPVKNTAFHCILAL